VIFSRFIPLLKNLSSCTIISENGAEHLHIACDDVKINHGYFCEIVVSNQTTPQLKQKVLIPYSLILLIFVSYFSCALPNPAEDDTAGKAQLSFAWYYFSCQNQYGVPLKQLCCWLTNAVDHLQHGKARIDFLRLV